MNCWEILEICSTHDIALVKKAYASKLKKARPDENPDAFRQLHTAYKQALASAKQALKPHQATPNEPFGKSIETAQEVAATTPTSNEQASECLAEVSLSSDQQLGEAWNSLASEVDHLLQNQQLSQQVAHWQFLEDTDALFYYRFKVEFSRHLFGQIIAYRLQDQTNLLRLSHQVSTYLNRLFGWTDQRRELEDEFGYAEVDWMLDSLVINHGTVKAKLCVPKQHIGPIVYANYYVRLLGTCLDISIVSVITLGLIKLAPPLVMIEQHQTISMIAISLTIYVLGTTIFEATPLQATPGKLLLGLKVTDRRGRRLSVLRSFQRSLCFVLSTLLFSITLWVNLITFDGRLVHDRCSGSLAIRR